MRVLVCVVPMALVAVSDFTRPPGYRSVTWTDVSGTGHTGTVTGVSIGASTPNLTVDGATVSLDAVSAVGTAPTATANTSGNATSGKTTGG